MTLIRRWGPLGASGAVLTATLFVSARAAEQTILLAPLPRSVRVKVPSLPELQAETAAPLFAPSRSNTPAGGADAAPQIPPPALSGIVLGSGRAVALLKPANGETMMAHVGETVDGWTVRTIDTRRVIFERGGEKETVDLVFGAPKPKADGPPPPVTAPPASPQS